MYHAGGRTDVTKLLVVFRNFANAAKEIKWIFAAVWCISIIRLLERQSVVRNATLRLYEVLLGLWHKELKVESEIERGRERFETVRRLIRYKIYYRVTELWDLNLCSGFCNDRRSWGTLARIVITRQKDRAQTGVGVTQDRISASSICSSLCWYVLQYRSDMCKHGDM